MGNNKPSIPKGSRDFGPEQVLKRNYIIDIIRDTFERYGYQPIETPAMESLSTLSGKYGDEGDKLLFRVLNSGDFLEKANSTEGIPSDYKTLTPLITGKGLRYDLTVPFARYVVMHQSEITFPFKRYQIQPVWRADRPQKGRYREFYQCDVDVIGSDSLLNELELLMITDEIFTSLKINVEIKINNRKVLQGLAEKIGHSDKFTDISTALDKFDKIGLQGVLQELDLLDIKPEGIQEYLEIEGANDSVINSLEKLIGETASGAIGIRELKKLVDSLGKVTVNCPITVDLKLARGLGYYTGTIMEVVALDTEMSSIAGGGRYDDLTGIFGLKDVSGVGISFGLDRIYDVLEGLELFPEAAGDPMLRARRVRLVEGLGIERAFLEHVGYLLRV
ncbi:MAG: histidine--tRNA ligase, partial [Bacteroidetes bacterium]|nr:histidine--tRNA ligase [Bacteroidota bacterium]